MTGRGELGDLTRVARGEHNEVGVEAIRDPRSLDDALATRVDEELQILSRPGH